MHCSKVSDRNFFKDALKRRNIEKRTGKATPENVARQKTDKRFFFKEINITFM